MPCHIINVKVESYYRNPVSDKHIFNKKVVLNEEQQRAVDTIVEDYDNRAFNTYLIRGVTGSGKTEVYLALIEQVLAKKKQVIVLIPEISLTYQTVRRFYERFGERIAVINSRMSKGEKSDACERIRAGEADVIIGAKNKDTLIFVNEMEAVAGNVYIATDDGSAGYKGLVTALLCDLIDNQGKHYDEVIAIGPMIMMKFVAQTTLKYGIKTIVSLNTLMVDGPGVGGACRVTVGGKTRFTCVDGPEFDGHQVDFDEAMRRQGMYRTIESRKAHMAEERAQGHACNIGLDR